MVLDKNMDLCVTVDIIRSLIKPGMLCCSGHHTILDKARDVVLQWTSYDP